MVLTTFDTSGSIGAVAFSVIIGLTIKALKNLMLFVWFFHLNFRVNYERNAKDIIIVIVGLKVDEKQR